MRTTVSTTLLLALGSSTGCGSDTADGEGTVQVTAFGESFIEDGIPAADVEDGWTIEFSRFEVTVQDVQVAGVLLADPEPVDVSVPSAGAGHELGSLTASAGAHGGASFTIARIELDGAATSAGETKSFGWVFDAPTIYADCQTTTTVPVDGSTTFQITAHADHLFYDSLVAAEPALLFQPLADADTDADGAITEVELAAADLGAYDPGNEDISDLWSWLVAQQRTLGHVDGEGHCRATASDD